MDPTSAASRRRFFIERALRMRTRGTGSSLARLLSQPPKAVSHMELFFGLPTMLIGAHAAAAYGPPRMTDDVDIVVAADRYTEAEARLSAAGWTKLNDLRFYGTRLGLRGGAWSNGGGDERDLLTSDQPWLQEAFAQEPVIRSDGQRVIPRDFLILMKLDSARGIDQGDLNRILGRMSSEEVERAAEVVLRHGGDAQMVEDLRQSAQIGRWEYETDPTHER